ncbi:MAG TPA: hypothetical protein VLW17_10420 [Thermoanaerobaculaceae bacterium]|nr:hypothetical protein [Thermoanaerobaculaceae bacterium]
MTCEEFRRRLDGDDPTITGEAAAHLERCADCRRLAERAASTRRALRALREEAPPPFLHARVMAHLRAAALRPRWWNLAVRPAWAGAALVALLLVTVSGYRLAEWLRPAPLPQPPPITASDLQAPAPAGESTVKAAPPAKSSAAPAAPATRHAANGGAVAKHRQTAPRAAAPSAGKFAPAPPALAAQREEAVAASGGAPGAVAADGTIAADATGNAAAAGELRESARLANAAPARPAAMAPQMQAMAATSHIAIACELAGDHGVVARFRLAPGEAPPGAAVWTVTVAADGSLAVRDPAGRDLPAARRPVAVALANTRLAAGTYSLRRVAP